MKKIKILTGTTLLEMLEQWEEDKYSIEWGLFLEYPKNGGVYVACDNTGGDCWVEEFETLEAAVKWLLDIE